ncbi:MAG: hypothetical protein FJ271_08015 [Planctomycetes bacterium]|nr:hypothetical protein [Planctomycetota bacterium]
MSRIRLLAATVITVSAFVALAQGAWSADVKPVSGKTESTANGLNYKVHALSEWTSAEMGKWIATTLPKVIEPATWSQSATKGPGEAIYQPATNILVVYQTPQVQAKVDAFLMELKSKRLFLTKV